MIHDVVVETFVIVCGCCINQPHVSESADEGSENSHPIDSFDHTPDRNESREIAVEVRDEVFGPLVSFWFPFGGSWD